MLTFARNASALAEPSQIRSDRSHCRSTHTRQTWRGGHRRHAGVTGVGADLGRIRTLPGCAGCFVVLPVAGIIYAARQPSEDAQRLAAIGVLFIAAMIFWAIFEQAGTTIALFADQLTRTEIAGVPFPSSWFQSVNPIFVIAAGAIVRGVMA